MISASSPRVCCRKGIDLVSIATCAVLRFLLLMVALSLWSLASEEKDLIALASEAELEAVGVGDTARLASKGRLEAVSVKDLDVLVSKGEPEARVLVALFERTVSATVKALLELYNLSVIRASEITRWTGIALAPSRRTVKLFLKTFNACSAASSFALSIFLLSN
jgi:hypothetical protein